jgi:mannose-6-phosphate isomerase
MKPIALPANQPQDRFYAGGQRIARFRGLSTSAPNTPEDWVASVTQVRGEPTAGLSHLPDGSLLVDAIAADPIGWLGRAHVDAFGDDPNLLVKLLDAGQRLPIHAHPDDGFASEHIGTAHGKAEAWYMLTSGTVHLGLTQSIEAETLLELVRTQDMGPLLDRMHAVSVLPGDTVVVPPGMLHAIGGGILLVEVQQPEDLSILLEWDGFGLDGERDGHLGIGFDLALAAVERTARSRAEVEELIVRAARPGSVLAPVARDWFRLDLIEAPSDLPRGFGVLVVLEGELVLRDDEGATEATVGTTLVIPDAAGAVRIEGNGRTLLCRPPAA